MPEAHLTEFHGADLALRIKATHDGQAHWAEPSSLRTCRECAYWKPTMVRWRHMVDGALVKETREALPYRADGELRARRCAKAAKFAGRPQARVPHDASSCRYFEAGASPLAPKIVPTADNMHLWHRHQKADEERRDGADGRGQAAGAADGGADGAGDRGGAG